MTQWNSGLTNLNRAVVKSLSKKTIIKVITTNHNGRKHHYAPLIQNFYQLLLTCSKREKNRAYKVGLVLVLLLVDVKPARRF